MSLKNLNTLVMELRKRYSEKFINKELELPTDFKIEFENYLATVNNVIVYLKYTSEVTTKTGQKIYFPNQWFLLAEYFTDYIIELERYKDVMKKIAPEYGAGFWDKVKSLKVQKDDVVISKIQRLLEPITDQISINYIINFLTDYSWWDGSKTIDRTDYFVSPILNMLGVINVSHSYLADIVYAYAKNDKLRLLAVQLSESNMKDETLVDVPETVKTGGINKIVYGAPGTGKSFSVNKAYNKITRVVFHAEYSYYDFVGSYKPVPVYRKTESVLLDSDNNEATDIVGEPLIDYRFVPGPFISALVDAFLNPNEMHTLIIEELNRGNAASIFGEMFQLLDREKSGKSEYPIKVNKDLKLYLQSIEGLRTFFSDGVITMPENLNIVATMNSADQGVFVLDSAFKRRWTYEYVRISDENIPHGDITFEYNLSFVKWRHFVKAINERLLELSVEEDRLIGPFFIKPDEIENVKNITSKLFLYLWDDVLRHKRRMFFGETILSYTQLIDAFFEGEDVFEISDKINAYVEIEQKNDEDRKANFDELSDSDEQQ